MPQIICRSKFIIATLICCLSSSAAQAQMEVSTKKSGRNILTIIKPGKNSEQTVDFCIAEPNKEDKQIMLSVAAAFTTTSAGISGAAICNGKNCGGPVNSHLAGAAVLTKGSFDILSCDHGKLLSKDYLANLQKSGSSLFQQFLLVNDSTAQTFKDKSLAPRRALAVMKSGERAIVQNLTPTTMGQFACDLQALGVNAAVYIPVGDGDGGWYRDGEKTISIGKTSSQVPVQSNWVVWKKSEKKLD